MTFAPEPNSFFQGEKGSTLLAQKGRAISLKSGQFLIGSQYTPISFSTLGTSTRLPSGALALVSVKANKETIITLLERGNATEASVKVTGGGYVGLKERDELRVASYTTSSNGTPRASVKPAGATSLRYNSTKTTVSIPRLMERNLLLCCRTVRLQNSWPYEKLDRKYGVGLARRIPAAPGEKAAGLYIPIAHVTAKPMDSWTSDHAALTKISEGHYFLSAGTILARGKQPLIVDTPHGSVSIKEDSVALVSIQNKMTRVFNLNDHHHNGVTTTVGNSSAELSPGREAIFVDASEAQIQRIVLNDGIGHKDLRIQQQNARIGIILGQYSMGDLLTQHPLLQQLRKSEDKSDKALVNALIKTAAAQATMN